MLDIKFIRDNQKQVRETIKDRRVDLDLDRLLEVDRLRRELIQQSEAVRAEQKQTQDRERGTALKTRFKELEKDLHTLDEEYQQLMLGIPNVPFADVPWGQGEDHNLVLREEGTRPSFDFTPQEHLDLGLALNLIDMERATKLSGSRFAYLKNEGVILEFALVQFALNLLRQEGFELVVPPVLIRQSITEKLGYWHAGGNENYYLVYDPVCIYCNQNFGAKRLHEAGLWAKIEKQIENTGFLPNKETLTRILDGWIEDNKDLSFILQICPRCDKKIEPESLYLAGTAEHAIVPMFKDEVIEDMLPKRFLAFSTCFRREAGTYGKDTRGILRVHQFDKLEMVSFVDKDSDVAEHDYLLSLQEKLFKALQIPYRVIKVCAGDLSFPAARQYDLEAWMPGQQQYREVTSTSTTRDFQSRRLNIKYKKDNSKEFAHIINGTAFAIGRTLIAIMENYQTKDGSIIIPEMLHPYTMGITQITKK